MDPEVPLDHGELQHGQEVDRGLFVASGDPTGVLEPANAAFNHIASAVGLSLEFGRPPTSGIVDSARGDHRLDVVLPKPSPDCGIVVGLVSCHLEWPRSWPTERLRDPDGAYRGLKTFDFVRLAGGDMDTQRSASAVSNHVDLGPPAAS